MQAKTQQSDAVLDSKVQVTKEDLLEFLDNLEKILKEAIDVIG